MTGRTMERASVVRPWSTRWFACDPEAGLRQSVVAGAGPARVVAGVVGAGTRMVGPAARVVRAGSGVVRPVVAAVVVRGLGGLGGLARLRGLTRLGGRVGA